jgi:hypothetical protein
MTTECTTLILLLCYYVTAMIAIIAVCVILEFLMAKASTADLQQTLQWGVRYRVRACCDEGSAAASIDRAELVEARTTFILYFIILHATTTNNRILAPGFLHAKLELRLYIPPARLRGDECCNLVS